MSVRSPHYLLESKVVKCYTCNITLKSIEMYSPLSSVHTEIFSLLRREMACLYVIMASSGFQILDPSSVAVEVVLISLVE